MIAAPAHTPESLKTYQTIWANLKSRLAALGLPANISSVSAANYRKSGYACYTCTGTLKPEFADLTSLEVAMLCDRGFSWFGGTCSLNDLSYNIKVYTD